MVRISKRMIRVAILSYLALWMTNKAWKSLYAPKLPPQTAAYINMYVPLAVEIGRETGIPSSIILAVAGLESGWGSSELARQGNNHFGIKTYEARQSRYCLPTQEFTGKKARRVKACFRAYDTVRESYQDFGYFLSSRPHYQSLFQYKSDDYRKWAHGLADTGYATDPEYAEKVIRVIRQYRLQDRAGRN